MYDVLPELKNRNADVNLVVSDVTVTATNALATDVVTGSTVRFNPGPALPPPRTPTTQRAAIAASSTRGSTAAIETKASPPEPDVAQMDAKQRRAYEKQVREQEKAAAKEQKRLADELKLRDKQVAKERKEEQKILKDLAKQREKEEKKAEAERKKAEKKSK